MSSGTAEGTVTGGSFVFTEDEMVAIIKNWHDLADSYEQSLISANVMSMIEPPAEDFASRFHAGAANRSGESYRK